MSRLWVPVREAVAAEVANVAAVAVAGLPVLVAAGLPVLVVAGSAPALGRVVAVAVPHRALLVVAVLRVKGASHVELSARNWSR